MIAFDLDNSSVPHSLRALGTGASGQLGVRGVFQQDTDAVPKRRRPPPHPLILPRPCGTIIASILMIEE